MNAKVVAQIFGKELVGRICFITRPYNTKPSVCRVISTEVTPPVVATAEVLECPCISPVLDFIEIEEHYDLTFCQWHGGNGRYESI